MINFIWSLWFLTNVIFYDFSDLFNHFSLQILISAVGELWHSITSVTSYFSDIIGTYIISPFSSFARFVYWNYYWTNSTLFSYIFETKESKQSDKGKDGVAVEKVKPRLQVSLFSMFNRKFILMCLNRSTFSASISMCRNAVLDSRLSLLPYSMEPLTPKAENLNGFIRYMFHCYSLEFWWLDDY